MLRLAEKVKVTGRRARLVASIVTIACVVVYLIF